METYGGGSKRVICTAVEDTGCIRPGYESAAEGSCRDLNHITRSDAQVADMVGPSLARDRSAVRRRRIAELVGAQAADQGVAAEATNDRIVAVAAEQGVGSAQA